jgi:hypothetical protein
MSESLQRTEAYRSEVENSVSPGRLSHSLHNRIDPLTLSASSHLIACHHYNSFLILDPLHHIIDRLVGRLLLGCGGRGGRGTWVSTAP